MADVKDLARFASLFLEDGEGEGSEGHGSGAALRGSLNALKWVARKTQATSLLSALSAPEVLGYLADSQLRSSRKEAPPIPLAGVIQLELSLRDGNEAFADRLLAGFLLTLVWGSLRFNDGLCTKPASLHLLDGVMRGEAWHTKTTDRGMPFGISGEGLLGGLSWCHVYKGLLEEWTAGLPTQPRETLDYLMPATDRQGIIGIGPITYVSAC